MAMIGRGRIWDEASAPAAERVARSYESAWRAQKDTPPDLWDFLPDEPELRSGALLALLRTDLALRWEFGESVLVEWYDERYPGLGDEILVALLYEEFCLREEAGEDPGLPEYEARFRHLAPLLGEVLEIHEWVGSTQSLSLPTSAITPSFPDVGQTIGGFRLVEELGRGAFARVYLARDRVLADRHVALKVSRRGSPEPQTLAQLQHTHIVPVYSYQTDAATGLHLLCMPYFGRVTLSNILSHDRLGARRSGSDLLGALDALRLPSERPSPRAEGRQALADRSFARAVAWWGARLAEALQHAHDRGILHSDVKPSNVLLTADAVPMLLDFNLAHSSREGRYDVSPPSLGGTLAYMAPEHLEAVANRADGRCDARMDLYSLGVVLFEAIATRPFASSFEGRTAGASIVAMIEQRRTSVPWEKLRAQRVPPALCAVIRKCLAPDPGDRYATAGQLAADLHAVADDTPLRYAREPLPSRARRWVWRNRKRLALAVPVLASVVALASVWLRVHVEGQRREVQVRDALEAGNNAASKGEFSAADAHFQIAVKDAEGWPALDGLREEAQKQRLLALDTDRARKNADKLFEDLQPIRSRLITMDRLETIAPEITRALAPLFNAKPSERGFDLRLLDKARSVRLRDEANEVLILWVAASGPKGNREHDRQVVAICDQALRFAEPQAPWRALKAWYGSTGNLHPSIPEDPVHVSSARACFEWALLALLDDQPERGVAWLERAVRLDPSQFWYQFALAYRYGVSNDHARALQHYDEALVLRPNSGWAHFNRAHLYWSKLRVWDRAFEDLERARQNPEGLDPLAIRVETGLMAQYLGDFATALREYNAVIEASPHGDPAQQAYLNRARLLADSGELSAALAEYDALLEANPQLVGAGVGRALVLIQLELYADADRELTRWIQNADEPVKRGELTGARALARLALGNLKAATEDAADQMRWGVSPEALRVWHRVALASGREADLGLFQPDDVARLPLGGAPLQRDLRAMADRLGAKVERGAPASTHLTYAVILSSLGRHDDALAEANRGVALVPGSAGALLTRARVRVRAGDRLGALRDLEKAIAIDPDDSRLLAFRGRLFVDEGRLFRDKSRVAAGLADLDTALLRGVGGATHAHKARGLSALEAPASALAEWSQALNEDPQNPELFLGRALDSLRSGQWHLALADLEDAAQHAADHPAILSRITLAYAACLPARPNRLPRVLMLARQSARSWLRNGG